MEITYEIAQNVHKTVNVGLARITSSQAWRDNPQIDIFSLSDKIFSVVIGACIFGMLIIMVLFFKSAWRNFRMKRKEISSDEP
jgi:hypothetical protein